MRLLPPLAIEENKKDPTVLQKKKLTMAFGTSAYPVMDGSIPENSSTDWLKPICGRNELKTHVEQMLFREA